MAVLLDVFASPRQKSSRTRALRDAFVEAWLGHNAGAQVLTVDLPALDAEIPSSTRGTSRPSCRCSTARAS
ncbi:MAG: NAD(P)H-dependent oxidoreductase [Myxococcales bacterium]